MSMQLEVVSGEMKGKSFQVTQSVVKVGAEAGNDLLLPEQQISREHAEFRLIGDAWYLIDLGSLNGVTVNGERIHTKTEIFDGDRVSFGPVEVVVRGAKRGKTAPMSTRLNPVAEPAAGRFFIGTGAQAGTKLALAKDRVTIGRDASNDLVVPATTVSAQHAILEWKGDASHLIDLGSTNGTFVNGEKIGTAVLHSGDRIRFDQWEYLYEQLDEAGPTVPRLAGGKGETMPRTVPRANAAAVVGVPIGAPIGAPAASPAVAPAAAVAAEPRIEGRSAPTQPAAAPHPQPRKRGPWLQVAGIIAILLAAVIAGLVVRDKLQRRSAAPAGQTSMPVGGAESAAIPPTTGGQTAEPVAGTPQAIDRLILRTSYATGLAGGILGGGVLTDLDGDGSPDAIAASMGGTVVGISGKGGRDIFRQALGQTIVSAPVLADLDGDGVSEAVVTTKEGEAIAVHRSGRVLWRSNNETGRNAITSSAAVADFTGDGIPDAVVCDVKGVVTILGGDRGWKVRKSQTLKGPFSAGPVVFPSASGATPNIVVAGESGMVYLLDGQSMKDLWQRDVTQPVTTTPVLHDFNDDGTPDVLVGCADASGTLVVLDGRNLQEIRRFRAGSPITAMLLVADLGFDSPTIICGTRDNLVALESSSSAATLWTYRNPSNRPIASAPALFDLDADGRKDVIVGVPDRGLVVLSGATGLEIGAFPAGGDVVSRPAVGDLDGDGNLDIVVTDESGMLTVVTSNRHVSSNAIIS
jgi:pSer/pThr/pTyr-binding forkhead associated (FHA) protein/outer membrane protein assembly factor BamB